MTTAESTSAVADQVAANCRRIDAVTAECVRALDAAGVPQLLLKGPTTARWLYSDHEPRRYLDSDLLVPPALMSRAVTALEGLGFVDRWSGYKPEADRGHAVTLYRARPDHVEEVDLHRWLALVTDPAAPVWEVLSRGAVDTVVAGRRMRMPGEAGRCLVAAMKAVQDGPDGAKALEDLRRARRVASAAVWAEAVAMAAELGVEHTARLGCRLAGAPLPGVEARADWSNASLDVRLCLTGGAPRARSLAGIRGRRGWARMAYVGRLIVPPRVFFIEKYGARTAPALLRARLHRMAMLAFRLPRALYGLVAATAPPAALTRPTEPN